MTGTTPAPNPFFRGRPRSGSAELSLTRTPPFSVNALPANRPPPFFPPAAAAVYCSGKGVEGELGDAGDALMRCEQAVPMLAGGIYSQSVPCDRPTPDLHLQDGSPQDTR